MGMKVKARSLPQPVVGSAGISLAGYYPAKAQPVERRKKAQPVKTAPDIKRE